MFKFTEVIMYMAPIGVGAAMAGSVAEHGLSVLLPMAKAVLKMTRSNTDRPNSKYNINQQHFLSLSFVGWVSSDPLLYYRGFMFFMFSFYYSFLASLLKMSLIFSPYFAEHYI